MKSTKISSKSNLDPAHLTHRIELFRYNIASCEMRFIERSERVISLVCDLEGDWCIQGCIPGCGAECDADLTTILLEYLMSCEGSVEGQAANPEQCFSERIVQTLTRRLQDDSAGISDEELMGVAVECIVRSLGEPAHVQHGVERISASFADCPLCVRASQSGMHRRVHQAHTLLVDIFQVLSTQLLPHVVTEVSGDHGEKEHGLELRIELNVN